MRWLRDHEANIIWGEFVVGMLLAAMWVAGGLWPDKVRAQDPVDCSVADHTALLQVMVDTQSIVSLAPGSHLCIRGNTGVSIPSNVTFLGNGSTLQIKPGCAIPQVCKILQTKPLAENIRIMDLRFVGDLTPAIGFQILLRVDQAKNVLIDNVVLENARSDAIQVTGNTTPTGNIPSENVLLRRVTSRFSSRNGGSAVNVIGLTILDSVFEDVNGTPVGPGAAFDWEPNGGGVVGKVIVANSIFRRAKIPIYVQRGQGNPGFDYTFVNNVAEDAGQIGFVMNCITDAIVSNTTIRNAPLGMSIGGFPAGPRPECRTHNLVVARTSFSGATTPFRLVGVVRPIVFDNGAAPVQISPGTGVPAVAGDAVFLRNGQ